MGAATGATGQAVNNVKPIQGGVPPQGGKGGVYQPTPRPQVQPPMPPQGGKGGVYQPMPGSTVPPQGGKATYTANTIGPDGRPIGAETANQYNAAKGAGTVQPGQVPAQGGKAPLTPQQQADLAPYIDPIRPQVIPTPVPQVMPMRPGQPTPFPAQQVGLGQAIPRPSLIGSGLAGLRGRR